MEYVHIAMSEGHEIWLEKSKTVRFRVQRSVPGEPFKAEVRNGEGVFVSVGEFKGLHEALDAAQSAVN